MSYFDHVRCPSCKAAFDPEKILVGLGGEASCPYCNAELRLKDMFGVKAAFSESDEPELDLDDLSGDSKQRPVWTGPGGWAPDPMEGAAPPPKRYQSARPSQESAGRSQGTGRGPRPMDGAESWRGGRGHVARQEDEGSPGTALEIMKRMKKD